MGFRKKSIISRSFLLHNPNHTTREGNSQTKLRFEDFERSLSYLRGLAENGSVSFETFFSHLLGKGKVLLLICMCLPLGDLPGFCILSGAFICYLGLHMAFLNKRVLLPRFLLKTTIPSWLLRRGISLLMGLLKLMKRWTKPRLEWATQQTAIEKLNGLWITLIGFAIINTPFIPFIGYAAYFAVLLISIGILNEDGLYILLGYGMSLVYFAIVLITNKYLPLDKLIDFFHKLF